MSDPRGKEDDGGGSGLRHVRGYTELLGTGAIADVSRQKRRGAIYKTKHKNHESHEAVMKIKGKSLQNVGSAWQRR